MTTQTQSNLVTLIGYISKNDEEESAFSFSHEVNGEKFFSFTLEVERVSGTKDYIPVIISEKMIGKNITNDNFPVCIKGQFRSRNVKDETKTHLKLYVFVYDIFMFEETCNYNDVYVEGFICKHPVYRVTPKGREITDIMLAVPRLCGKSDYIPCICWGRNALYALHLPVGTKIKLAGRIQSREFQKQLDNMVENRTAYELSVSQIFEE